MSTNEESRLIPCEPLCFSLCNYFILFFGKLILLSFVMVPLPTNLNLEIEMTPVQRKPGAYMSAQSRAGASALGLVLVWGLVFPEQPFKKKKV